MGRQPDVRAPHPLRTRRVLLPWLAGVLSLTVTVTAILWTRALIEHDRDIARDRHTATVTEALEAELQRYADLLRATNAFFASSTFVEPKEFESFIAGLDLPNRYPGAQTIISARRDDGALISERVAPKDAALYAPGQDLADLPQVAEAADQAERTGLPTMTAPLTQPDGTHELFIMQPDTDGPWILVRVALAPLLQQVAAETQSTEDAITLTDVTAASPSPATTWNASATPDGPRVDVQQMVMGRTWDVTITHPDEPSATGRLVALVFLAMGIAESIVVIWALVALTRSGRRAMALAEQASESEERRRRLVELAPVAIVEISSTGTGSVVQANAAARTLLGDGADIADAPLDATVLTEPAGPLAGRLDDLHGEPLRIRSASGDHDVVAYATPVTGESDADHLLVLIDETARRRLEDRLAEAEKMEALGLLAGGVAHDFNNLLMPIQGFIELVLLNEALTGEDRLSLEEAHAACDRAAALVEQLLTTSRPEVGSHEPADLVAWVQSAHSLLRSMLPTDIRLDVTLPPGAPPAVVPCDATRLEQIVVNLVVNARDAMRTGGLIEIEVVLDGALVCLTVRDDGEGMDATTRAHIFEPFFTTKARRGGTGLGLATVYSTVVKAGGTVTVDSTPGQGSVFTVCLPLVGRAPFSELRPRAGAPRAGQEPSATAAGHRPTLLLVDDEEYARQLLRQILADEPYELLVASSAEQAEELALTHGGPIDLLVTDVVLGGRSGPELADGLRVIAGSFPVIFVSGYVDDEFGPKGSLPANAWFLAKPFRIEDLRALVRLALSVDAEHR